MQVLVDGVGAVGARVARQLIERDDVERVLVAGTDDERVTAVLASCGPAAVPAGRSSRPDAVVLARPAGTHAEAARVHLAEGRPVVSVSDDVGDVTALLDLDAEARARDVAVVAGAGFAPGLSCLLVAHAASRLDEVEEIRVARSGAGGPACARHLLTTLRGRSLDWHDHRWRRRLAGVGRERCWFPDPVGGLDCYPARLPDPLLLMPAFPGVRTVSARLAASTVDRVGALVGVPRRFPPEGTLGALRVEVRGRRSGVPEVVVLGALDRPAVAAATVAALAAVAVADRTVPAGAAGLAGWSDTDAVLRELATVGVKAAEFTPAG